MGFSPVILMSSILVLCSLTNGTSFSITSKFSIHPYGPFTEPQYEQLCTGLTPLEPCYLHPSPGFPRPTFHVGESIQLEAGDRVALWYDPLDAEPCGGTVISRFVPTSRQREWKLESRAGLEFTCLMYLPARNVEEALRLTLSKFGHDKAAWLKIWQAFGLPYPAELADEMRQRDGSPVRRPIGDVESLEANGPRYGETS